MRLWPRRRKAEERAITYQDLWGSGANIPDIRGDSVDRAITLGAVFAATRLLSDHVASLPLQAYRKSANGDQRRIDTPKLLADPSMFGGQYEWVQRAVLSLALRGNAYGFITAFDNQGFPRQVEWLHPDEVTLENDRTAEIPRWRWEGRPLRPWLGRDSQGELIHIPWYVLPGRVKGVSPISAFAQTIEGGLYAQRFGHNFFKTDGVPSGVLETDQQIDQEQAQTIKDRFKQAAKGRDTVVLGAGAKYHAITVSPEESQFLETIRANATTIAAIYGIYPAELIGGDTKDSMTYANVEQQSLNLATHTLRPWITKLEQHLSTLLPRPQFARFDLNDLLRADRQTRYETHQIAIANGFKTPDEVREEEGLEPLSASEKQELQQPALPAGNDQGGGQVVQLPRASNE
jgi:HK97 family phage portal protein